MLNQNNLNETEAASSRFFIDPMRDESITDQSFYRFSRGFYLENCDLIVEDRANLVFMTGLGETGMQVEAGMGVENVSVVFEKTKEENDEYRWGLIVARPPLGREATSIKLNPEIIEAKKHSYDAQGAMRKHEAVDGSALLMKIASLVMSELFVSNLRAKREARNRAEIELSNFSVAGILQYSPNKYRGMLAGKEELIKKIGFSVTQSIVL